MLERIDASCPACQTGRLTMNVSVNVNGDQTFQDGQIQHLISCGNCGTRSLVTLHGAGREPSIAPLPTPPEQHQEGRGHSTHR